jgi:hypothetical protein
MTAQVGGEPDVDIGVARGECAHLAREPLDETPVVEEEVGEDEHALGRGERQPLRRRLEQRRGDADEARLAPGESARLAEEAHHLAEVAVGVGVARTAPHGEEHGSPGFRRRQDGAGSLEGDLEHGAVDAEGAGRLEVHLGKGRASGVEGMGDFVLHMAGGEQEEREQHHPVGAGGEAREPLAEQGLGELDLCVANIELGAAAAKSLHESLELLVGERTPAAVTEH